MACPLCGSGHGSSVGEWSNTTACPLHGPGSIPGCDEVFKGIFPYWSHSANPSRDRVSENGWLSPEWHHIRIEGLRRKAHIQPDQPQPDNDWCAGFKSFCTKSILWLLNLLPSRFTLAYDSMSCPYCILRILPETSCLLTHIRKWEISFLILQRLNSMNVTSDYLEVFVNITSEELALGIFTAVSSVWI